MLALGRRHCGDAGLVALLLAAFCLRIWSFGITTTDDGWWALWAHQPDQHPIRDFAVGQGRLWAFGGGAWILHGLRHAGTLYGDALVTGSFVLFFLLYALALAVYWSPRIAVLAAGIFLATFVLRADRSILSAYPLFFWMPASAALAGLLAARRWQHGGGRVWLAACGVLLGVALFNNEGAMLLTLLAVPAALFVHHRQRPDAARLRAAGWVAGSVCAAFVAATLAWRLLHPSLYSGNSLAPFSLHRIGEVLLGFMASGTLWYDMVHPYALNIADAVARTGGVVTYVPRTFLRAAAGDPASLLVGGLTGLLVLRSLGRPVPAVPGWRGGVAGVAVGLAIAAVPLLPVAMSSQYQTWFYDHGAHAYSHTVFAAFGLALMAAVLLHAVAGRGAWRQGTALAAAAALGLTAMVGNRMNDAIAHDLRPEAGRWRVLRGLVEIARATGTERDTVFMPRLGSGTWFATMPAGYWTEYVRDVLGSPLRVTEDPLTVDDAQDGAAYADYQPAPDGRGFVVVSARLDPAAAVVARADRIAVLLDAAGPAAGLVLSYRDARFGPQLVPLASLRQAGPVVRVLDGVQADPGSIAVLGQSRLPELNFTCDARMLAAGRLRFSLQPGRQPGCFAGAYLGSGWTAPEAGGTWSVQNPAELRLPTAGLPEGDLSLTFDGSTYSGLGFHDQPQAVEVTLDGRRLARWMFTPGTPLAALPPVVIPAQDWRGRAELAIQFVTAPLFNPSRLGKAPDNRDLGFYLRGVVVAPAGR